MPAAELTIVVLTYGMNREAPRTVRSLTRPYQEGIDDLSYEVVVIDNASPGPLDAEAIEAIAPNVTVVRRQHGGPSPGPPINEAVRGVGSPVLGIVVDGARMVTPGTVSWAMRALRRWPDAFVTTAGWHLGPAHQSQSMKDGYSASVEDELLEGIDWPDDGYRLFEISVPAGANPTGFLDPRLNESPCFFVRTSTFRELGGFDERFETPGGGFVNLDFFERAIAHRARRHVVLLGEGSFHQIHGGAATNAEDPAAAGQAFLDEYERLQGQPYAHPAIDPVYFGHLPKAARRHL